MKHSPFPAWLTNPYLLLTLTALSWSGNMVIGRAIRSDVPPIALAFWRWIIVLTLLLPLALPHLRTQWKLLLHNWRAVIALGILGIGGYNTFAYLALQHTTATNASLLNSFIPIATITFAFLLLGKRLHRIEAIGVIVSLAGVITIVSHGELAILLGLHLNRGDLWMLLAITVWGLYTVGLHWRPQGVAPALLLAALTVVGILVLAPAYAWEISSGHTISLTSTAILGILYTGIFPGFIGYLFYNAGVAAVGPSRSALFIHLMPVFSTILAAIFLDERPEWYHGVGILLVFSGIAFTMQSSNRPAS